MANPRTRTRYLRPYHGGGAVAVTDATPVTGRVLLSQIDVPTDCFVDAIILSVGTVQSGNLTAGIYGPIAFNDETCAGAAVVVQSASTAVGSASSAQIISITETFIRKGRYYLALEFDNTTARYFRHGNGEQVTGWGQLYDRGGGYGALTDPCPAITPTASNIPGLTLRVSK